MDELGESLTNNNDNYRHMAEFIDLCNLSTKLSQNETNLFTRFDKDSEFYMYLAM